MVSSQQHDNKLDTPTSVDNSNIINSSPTTNETQWSEAVVLKWYQNDDSYWWWLTAVVSWYYLVYFSIDRRMKRSGMRLSSSLVKNRRYRGLPRLSLNCRMELQSAEWGRNTASITSDHVVNCHVARHHHRSSLILFSRASIFIKFRRHIWLSRIYTIPLIDRSCQDDYNGGLIVIFRSKLRLCDGLFCHLSLIIVSPLSRDSLICRRKW